MTTRTNDFNLRAQQLDAQDVLAAFRAQFELPIDENGVPLTYLCGNSLGPLPKDARRRMDQALNDWSQRAVQGHHHGPRPWIPYHEEYAAPLAHLVGAEPQDVVLMNLLTVNLHLMMVSFYRPHAARYQILIEQGAFPSDHYAVESQLQFHGYTAKDGLITVGPRTDEDLLRTEDIIEAIEKHAETLALVLLPGVQYRTGQVLDIQAITQVARRLNITIGWDLAHSIGNLPLSLAQWGPDFAVWCTYKYLCGGPGSVAGAYVNARYRDDNKLPRFAGWWGHDKATRFEMGPDFNPIPGAQGWQLSNSPVLAMVPLAASLQLYEQAGVDRLRRKSLSLTEFAFDLLDAELKAQVTCITPRAASARGCQLSLRVHGGKDRARQSFDALTRRGIIGDWREPDVIRLAPHPLYNSHADVLAAIRGLAQVLQTL